MSAAPVHEVTIQVFADAAQDVETTAKTLGVSVSDYISVSPYVIAQLADVYPEFTRKMVSFFCDGGKA